ncbi:ABC-type sugar transport systems, ATPase [Zymobacter palmae]|uniref:ABC-type sugar transport systems, ATPase n=1 Tax=Zymobacter palmae TaxID=33074 RepID=A0A348HBZ8_9GAMM|nr:ABC-type sugar transport systems, ATPase [Zymobacter palmae]
MLFVLVVPDGFDVISPRDDAGGGGAYAVSCAVEARGDKHQLLTLPVDLRFDPSGFVAHDAQQFHRELNDARGHAAERVQAAEANSGFHGRADDRAVDADVFQHAETAAMAGVVIVEVQSKAVVIEVIDMKTEPFEQG